jgi:hypothetical protein
VTKEEGSYSAKVHAEGASAYYGLISQTCTGWSNVLRNRTATITCRCKKSHATYIDGYLIIEDGVATVTATAADTTDWQTLTANITFNAAATGLIIRGKSHSAGVTGGDVYFESVVVTLYDGSVGNFVTFNGKVYYSNGGYLFNSDSATAVVKAYYVQVTSLAVFGDYLFVALGATTAYEYMNTAGAFTASSLADPYANEFAVVGVTLWKSNNTNEVKSNTSGLNGGAAWSGATTVGSSYDAITSLLSYNDELNVFKEDRSYYLDSAGAVHVWTDATLPMQSSTGGTLSLNWNGNTYAVWGNNLLENSDGSFRWLSPINYFSNASNFCGNIVGITGDNKYLYIMVDDSTSVHILAGRDETNDNGTQWIWHPFSYFSLGTGTALFCSNITDERIWIGGADSIYYIDNDITTSGLPGKTFSTSGYMTTCWYHLDFKGDNKAFIKLTLNMESTTSALYFTVSYKKWNDSSWTSIGNFQTSPSTTAYIPVDGSDNKPVSTYIKFKIAFTSNASTTIFKLHSLDLRAVLYPARRKIHRIVCRAGDMILDKQGNYLDTPTNDIDAALEEAMNTTYPFTFYDLWGNTKTGKLLPATPFKKPAPRENSRGFDTLYILNIEEITTS